MNCVDCILSYKYKEPLNVWAQKPLKYETDIFVKDILNEISQRVYAWITTRDDLEIGLSYESFRDQYSKVLYYGYKTKKYSDTVTDYFDIKYLEEIGELYNECMSLATHYQLDLPDKNMMDTLEYIRDTVSLYESEEEDIVDDEFY